MVEVLAERDLWKEDMDLELEQRAAAMLLLAPRARALSLGVATDLENQEAMGMDSKPELGVSQPPPHVNGIFSAPPPVETELAPFPKLEPMVNSPQYDLTDPDLMQDVDVPFPPVPHAGGRPPASRLGSLLTLASQELESLKQLDLQQTPVNKPQGDPGLPPKHRHNTRYRDRPHDPLRKLAEEGYVGAFRTRARPRSVSNPEGMDLQGWRAMAGVPDRRRKLSGIDAIIEAIKEDADCDAMGMSRRRRMLLEAEVERTDHETSNSDAGDLDNDQDADDDSADRESLGEGPGGDEEGEGEGLGDADNAGEAREVATLPHLLSKYAGLYNANGRIGIYTKEERMAILMRFKTKRQKRVWRKKVRYNCRKNLADKRLRIKGRFVKMTPEQKAALDRERRAGGPGGRNRGNSQGSEGEAGGEENRRGGAWRAEEEGYAVTRLRRHSIAY